MEITAIVAHDLDRGIGKNGKIPWRIPSEMEHFKNTTLGGVVIMGRTTYESFPEKFRPLPFRKNIVLTRNKEYVVDHPDVFIVHTINEALDVARQLEKNVAFLIGGGEIYREFLDKNLIKRCIVSVILEKFGADTFFPKILGRFRTVRVLKRYTKNEEAPHAFNIILYE